MPYIRHRPVIYDNFVVDDRIYLHGIIRGVVSTSELVVDLKLCRGMLPLLTVVVEHAFALIVGNINAL